MAMLVLLAENNALAIHGTVLHMLNHSLFKLVLFMAAGIIYMNRRELELDKIRGFGRGKPFFLFIFLMAGFGICGLPFWSGFASKTLLHKSLTEGVYLYQGLPLEIPLRLSYMALVFTGGLTVAYMTKLFVTLFVQKGAEGDAAIKDKKRYISRPAAIALTVSAALAPFLGSFTGIMDALAVWGQDFFHGHAPYFAMPYFAWVNLQGAFISIAIGAAVYILVVRGLLMRRKEDGTKVHAAIWPDWLDLENLIYRPLLSFLTLKNILNTGQKPQTPVRFLSVLNMKFSRLLRLPADASAMIGQFSLDMLFVGMGICLTLVYVFIRALG